jgi:Transposase DDE domain
MGAEVNVWGLDPAGVTGDGGDAGTANLKFLRNEKVGFLFGIADHRKLSLTPGKFVQGQTLTIPEGGLTAYLKAFGWVKVLCQNCKHEVRYDIMYQPDPESCQRLSRADFWHVPDHHWQIERFHRVFKQVCNIERFQVRTESAIKTHFFCALQAFCQLQTMRVEGLIDNLYQVSRQLFVPVIRQFILENLTQPTSA